MGHPPIQYIIQYTGTHGKGGRPAEPPLWPAWLPEDPANGYTDPRHKSRKTKYEVKPQYEELSKQLNMQHAINQCYECMKAIKESDSYNGLSTGKSNQASIPLAANQPVENHRSVIIGARQPITARW
ncbi:hypothetical protein F511_45496 [Dorcoceras hygrometricum]|uniref:Uncharacterized protein n=1 Tax=Dorcoceras hygrometricum TaxID=472368 RepID=A0A2Z6ZWB4_9LAMI|nr:hypothetical protein F511_45496 [Dorcoceras hygrometricum]